MRSPVMHELKIQSKEYDSIISGVKNYIIIHDNMNYMLGDMICFKNIQCENKETCFKISCLSRDCTGLKKGYCIIGW